MSIKMKKSLADKINSLITTTPANFGSDEEAEETKAKVVERYDESDNSDDNFRYSKIRKQNVDPLDKVDKRYAGKKVSRKEIYNSDDDSSSNYMEDGDSMGSIEDAQSGKEYSQENIDSDSSNDEKFVDDDDDDDDSSIASNEGSSLNDEGNSEATQESGDESDIDNDDYDINVNNYGQKQDRSKTAIQTISSTSLKADVEKGNCVRSQLKLWENLLEMRIKLQKCLVTSNQMPQYDVHKGLKTSTDFMKKTNEVTSKLTMLLNKMLHLQDLLLKQYPETANLNVHSKKRKASDNEEKDTNDPMDEEIPSDTEDENEDAKLSNSEKEDTEELEQNVPQKRMKLVDYANKLDGGHKAFKDYRNTVIQKWNEKTRITTGNVNKGMNQTTLKQIEFALSDKQKLLKKTQLKRSEYNIIGKTETTVDDNDGRRVQEHDSEIYDDDDFYHQLLRDLIEFKSSDVTDPIQLSKQWIQLQNMRRKLKRKIDTRATKGRRIRYDVHNKLVNFMAPITVNDTWSDQAKNDLYNSLFGKVKPANTEVSL